MTLLETRNLNRAKIKHNNRHILNKMVNINNSFFHELAKLYEGLKDVYEGSEVLIEAEFEDGSGFADILNTDVSGYNRQIYISVIPLFISWMNANIVKSNLREVRTV